MTSAGGTGGGSLPSPLREAIVAKPGGRVVLVIGAGTSVEPPMALPMADECSEKAHRELLRDEVLEEGDCPEPSDLSVLADTVYQKNEGKQEELVKRLPILEFRTVTPNKGCLLAAALLREKALKAVLTLNFDLGMVSALSVVGMDNDVAVLMGPEDHDRMGTPSLVYLHRSVEAEYEAWVLRTAEIEDGWSQGWEEVVSGLLIGGPFTVFAGLGSPAGVLVATADNIKKAVPDGARLLQVDPLPSEKSTMRERLGIEDEDYLQMGWCQFMEKLGARVLARQRDELYDACKKIIDREGFDDEDPEEVCDRLVELDLLDVGYVRARWLLRNRHRYLPLGEVDIELVASLLLAIALVERRTGTTASFHADGVVEFVKEGRVQSAILVASGAGTKSWSTVEAELARPPAFERTRRPVEPRRALLAGVGARLDVAPPPSLVGRDEEDSGGESILGDREDLIMRSVDELRTHPELLEEMIA